MGRPKTVIIVCLALVLFSALQIGRIKVDTDPENMLPADAPVRVFHEKMKKEFDLYDMVVLGVENGKHPDGVFNVGTLTNIFNITKEIEMIDGVIASNVMAPSTQDNIEQAGLGAVRFNWLMESPPQTRKEALAIRDKSMDHPVF